jgi:flagellar biosynthetic protein FliQ
MNEADVGGLLRETMFVVLRLGGPPLAVALATGLVTSLFQAVTQINEHTLAFLPKVVAIIATMALLGPFMFATLNGFARLIFDRLVAVGGQ